MKIIAFLAGIVFAIGLGISGMTDPAKVQGFLDVTGAWDASLIFVMGGAIGAHVLVAQWARRATRPLFASAFELPKSRSIDARLLGGAALFGIGWGIAGFCPGPALVALVGLSRNVVLFVIAMAVSTALVRYRSARSQ